MLQFLFNQQAMQLATTVMKLQLDNVIDLAYTENDASEDYVAIDLTCLPQKQPVPWPYNPAHNVQGDGNWPPHSDELNSIIGYQWKKYL